jgi:hypothetical protein
MRQKTASLQITLLRYADPVWLTSCAHLFYSLQHTIHAQLGVSRRHMTTYPLESVLCFTDISTQPLNSHICTATMHCLAATQEHLLGVVKKPNTFAAVAMALALSRHT